MQPRAQSIRWTIGLCLAGIAATPAWSQVQSPSPGTFIIRPGVGRCTQSAFEGTAFNTAQQAPEKGGVPYSAVGVTEIVTTLADGNRITRKNTMRYFRDGRGRTRTEFDLATVGPVPLEGKRTPVTINDPVAKTRYILHPEAKLATIIDSDLLGPNFAAGSSGVAVRTMPLTQLPNPEQRMPGSDVIVLRDRFVGPQTKADCEAPAPIPLGERTIEGLKAVGSKIEVTIAAGEVGNELPMTMTTEQWFSPELGVVLSSTHRDPMSGDTTYRLTEISRTEPDAKLFTVPADYTRAPMRQFRSFQKFEMKTPPAANTAPAAAPAPGRSRNQ